jgi:hypothetical protein
MTMRISSYPHEFVHIVTIEIDAAAEEYCIIGLSDLSGAILRMLGVNLLEGVNTIPLLNLETLSPGSYNLDVKDTYGRFLYSTELIKQ